MMMQFELHSQFPVELEEQWNSLLAESSSHVPFLRFEYLSDWWSTRGGGEWADDSQLAILTAVDGHRLVGIAPLFIPGGEEEKRLMLLGSIEISDFLDFICRPGDLESFLAALLLYLKDTPVGSGEVRTLDLYNILEDSPSFDLLHSISRELDMRCEQKRLQHSPFIPLPGSWEGYLERLDKKQRHEIRRKMRRAAEGDTAVELYVTSEPSKLEDDMDDFLDLMAQDEDKADFLSPMMREQMKLTARCAFSKDCLQLAFLHIGGRKAAAYLNFDFLNRIWVYNSGVDWSYMSYSPGWVLLGHLIQWASENGRQEFDFMRGSEDYKYRFGAVDRFVTRTTITL